MRNSLAAAICFLSLLVALPIAAQEISGNFQQGSVKVGYDSATCDVARNGAIRYVSGGNPPWEFCNGSAWSPFKQPRCTNDATGECYLATPRSGDDADFIAANIKDAVNILGVTGTYTGGGGPACDTTPTTYTTPSTYSYTVPANCGAVTIQVYGAGGGGGRSVSSGGGGGGGGGGSLVQRSSGTNLAIAGGGGGGGGSGGSNAGGGGGGGAYAIAVVSVTSGESLNVWVGGGGVAGVSSSTGGNGGSVSGGAGGNAVAGGTSTYGGGGGGGYDNSSSGYAGGASTYGGGGGGTGHSNSKGGGRGGNTSYGGGGGGGGGDGSSSQAGGTSTSGNNGVAGGVLPGPGGGGGGGGGLGDSKTNGSNGTGSTGGTAANSGPGNGGTGGTSGGAGTNGADGKVVITPSAGSGIGVCRGQASCLNPGDLCSDGTIFSGCGGASYTPFYVTRCDGGQTWSGSACTGTRVQKPWNDGNTANYTTTNVQNDSDGAANTVALTNGVVDGTGDSSTAVGLQPHQAAQYCADLVIHGYSDWYLPAPFDLFTMWVHSAVIGNFTTADYWSSAEYWWNTDSWRQSFNDGARVGNGSRKEDSLYVRCARRP